LRSVLQGDVVATTSGFGEIRASRPEASGDRALAIQSYDADPGHAVPAPRRITQPLTLALSSPWSQSSSFTWPCSVTSSRGSPSLAWKH